MTTKNKPVILVTGATGRIGRLVVDELIHTGVAIRALTRQPEKAGFPAGVEVIAGDFTVPSSLDSALDGVAAVFLVWTTSVLTAPDVVKRIATYSLSQPRRLVYLSAPYQTQHPFFQQPNPMRDLHAEIERLLKATNLELTILRPGMFSSNALHWWAPQIRKGNVVRWPYAEVETAPIDEQDIAAVAVRKLLESGQVGGDYVLTGSESLSQATQVHVIGGAIGRPLKFEELTPEEFRRETTETWPTGIADMLLSAWNATLGYRAFVTNSVNEIIGSPPRTFYQWAVDNAEAFLLVQK